MLRYLTFLPVISFLLFAQGVPDEYFVRNGEVCFRFKFFSEKEIPEISKIISIDGVSGKYITAYANKDEFRKFEKLGYSFEVLPPPGDKPVQMGDPRSTEAWDVYPTYEGYVQMMNSFASDYPNLCRLVDAGNTVQGRKILFLVITKNVNNPAPKPRFMHTSSMHGDETAAYVNMLRFADYLLVNYNSDPFVTNLVDNVEIWINPLANPDGTYRSGNSTVSGARRGNANNIDINRNFPDAIYGDHPDGYAWQPETIVMMNLAKQYNFNMSINYHGGAEVVNYPWDNRTTNHADNNWWVYIARRYADTVHNYCNNNGYLSDFNNGIVRGCDWYTVFGGRQDWMTYFHGGREMTIELSNTKLISASYIPTIWQYNRASWLNVTAELLTGIQGRVTDPDGNPVKVKVSIPGHDITNSEVFSDSISGYYARLIEPGTYALTFSAPGYTSVTVPGLLSVAGSRTIHDIVIYPTGWVPVEFSSFTSEVVPGGVELKWRTASETNNRCFIVELAEDGSNFAPVAEVEGAGTSTDEHFYSVYLPLDHAGAYYFRIKQTDFDGTAKFSQVVKTEFGAVKSFRLSQNYPNPFNSSTILNFSLPVASDVALTVYSIEGRVVARRDLGLMPAGEHSYRFEAAELTSGNYIITLNAGTFTASRKVTYLK
ncbi:MAG: carboxypeptidase regulatory-like domain-containing protein [Ignavibacteriales bacterium]|nr:MAG: T9SS type A sorting domain-containing protein [Ignavibacteriaceae bacterium]MBW7874125.1 carboxypeptidase regulatory-like domain-containing protein [Ignavibacteria bacterium]MCZ2142900.1 carboxypeptidase regulatory-like domain-containing protein [Ignavibacteriales bacterium]OQY76393.1 MAG: hypothetical protein B6D45_03650 [Ignavibacteriales bacterium UTCHB3]MBV6444545.1 hypothetical protein [Ignavibacteriaceae bacterium]